MNEILRDIGPTRKFIIYNDENKNINNVDIDEKIFEFKEDIFAQSEGLSSKQK